MDNCPENRLCDLAKVKFVELEKRYEDRFAAQKEALFRLEQRYEERFLAQKEAISKAEQSAEERFVAQKEAISKAEQGAEERFRSVNEFRAVLTEQQRTLITRSELEAKLESIYEKIDSLKSSTLMAEGTGKGTHAVWGYIMGAIGLILTILTISHMLTTK
jgi:predicted  nucleic acid-binding Zn-ribbon protein